MRYSAHLLLPVLAVGIPSALAQSGTTTASVTIQTIDANPMCGPFQLSGNRGAGYITPEGIVITGGTELEMVYGKFMISSTGLISHAADGSPCSFRPYLTCAKQSSSPSSEDAETDTTPSAPALNSSTSFWIGQYGSLSYNGEETFLYCNTANLTDNLGVEYVIFSGNTSESSPWSVGLRDCDELKFQASRCGDRDGDGVIDDPWNVAGATMTGDPQTALSTSVSSSATASGGVVASSSATTSGTGPVATAAASAGVRLGGSVGAVVMVAMALSGML